MAQHYPPDNGDGEATFSKWYVDEVSGMMVRRSRVARDVDGVLRDRWEFDELGRDDLARAYPLRTERPSDLER